MAIGRSSDGCRTGAGDDCDIKDESTIGPVGGRNEDDKCKPKVIESWNL